MKVGLAYAMGGEIESLLHTTGTKLLETICGIPIFLIERDILAYAGGVGKVNAAMSAQIFIDRYQPDWIVNVGVAGSFPDLKIGTVVLAKDFVQHDVDTSPMGDPIGMVSTVNRVEFPTDDLERMQEILSGMGVEFVTGRVATGDIFMTRGDRANWIDETFAPTLCEMEGGAIAQVCRRNGVKFTALKSVSDRLRNENNAEEFFQFAPAMEKLNRIALPTARTLRDGD